MGEPVDVNRSWRVRPITKPIAFPLHQRRLTVVQRHGRSVALVVGIVAVAIGMLFVAGWASDHRSSGLVAAAIIVAAGLLVLVLSSRFGRFDSAAGMVTLQPDRLEIADDRHLAQPVVLLRHEIVAVCSPGMASEQPGLRRDVATSYDIHCVGHARPNLEIWLRTPLERPSPVAPPGWPRRPVVALQVLTPGAATVMTWFRSGLTEGRPTPVFGVDETQRLGPHQLE